MYHYQNLPNPRPHTADDLRRINHTPFMRASHITITALEGDRAAGELEVLPGMLNHHGFVHGGVLTMLADTVAGTAAGARGGRCVTLDNTMHYLRPAVGGRIFCAAEPVRVGRTISTVDASLTDQEGRQVARGTFTFHINRGLQQIPALPDTGGQSTGHN